MLVRMDHTKVVILILLIIYSTVNCQQNADEDEDMLIDDQRKMNEAAENDSEPLVLSTDLDKQMQANPIPLMPNNEDAEFLEKKTLARLIEALKEKDSMQNSNGGPEIRMQSTGDEPVPLKELMTPEDSMSMSEESSGETPESESKEALEIWENPEVFDQIIGIPGDATEGSTVVQLTAHHPLNLSMDFLCINPQIVICYSDKFANNKYQLRIALNDAADIPNHFIIRFHVLVPDQRTGADMIFEDKTYVLNFSYEADQTTPYPASKSTVMNVVVNSNQLQANHNVKPVFEFMPQFEKDTYDVTVLEGVNEKPMTMAIIYFMSRVNGPAPTFAVVDDTLEWFEIGEITSQQDPNRVLSAVKLMLRKGISAMKKNIDLPYRFMIEAKQADTTAHATVNVDLLSFDEPQAAKDDKATETSATIVTPKLPVSPSTPSSLTTTTANPETEEPAKATPSIVTPKLRASSATPAPPSSTTTTQVTVDDAMDKELQHVETTNKEEEQLTTLAVTVTSSTNSPETTAELTTKLLTEMQSTTVVTESTTTTTIRTTPKQTPPTTLPEIDVSLIVTGAPNGKAVVSELLRNGESVPDLEIRVMADQEHNNELVDLELSSTEAFIIRPRRIQIGGTAQLIVANNHLLDYETYPTTFTVEIRALLKNNHNIVRTEKIKFEKKDELDHAPYFAQASYEFEVAENSVTGEAVGQLSVRDEDKTDELSFELFGENTELFSVNDNVLIVSCKTAMPCLDREQTSIYYFALVATDKAGHSSDPVTITIHVNDKNDNGPKIDLSDDVLRISNGELLAPFVFKVTDADLIPRFTIETDGSAAGFLEVSKVSGGLHQIRPKIANIPFAGNFELELTAKDPSNEVSPDKKIVKVQVKNTISKAHFRRARYERTITTEKIHKGNPLVQLELEGVPIDTVRFVILNNNPGWLSIDDYGGNVFVGDTPTKGVASGHRTVDIGVIDRQSKTILAQTQLILTIIGSRKTESIFKERLYTHVVSKEAPIANAVIALSTTEDKPSMLVISDSITAWNTEHKPEHFPATAVTIEGNNVVLGVEHTSKLRSLQLQVASVEDMSDRALVTVYFSSDPVKVAQKKKQDSKPQFVAPWTPESIVIPVKLVEEAPVGQIAASLPAYDPMTGNRITAVELTGQMADFFSIDPVTQDILVAKRIDFESLSQEMKAFDMELIAGEDEYKTKAVLRFQIIDVDDNMPRIEFLDDNIKNNVIVVMENSPPGTEIARFKVLDDDVLDGNQKFSYQVSGFMHDNFQIREMPEFMVVVVSPAADLDREKTERMEIVIKVTDTAGNSNVANLIITLDDQNDNAPKFLDSKVSVKVTENWQIGSTITRLIVSDKDLNENSRFSFYLAEDSSPYFDVDEDSGVVTTVKNLNGLARIEPYKVNVICKDNGRPQLSAVAIVSVTIVEAVLISNEGKNELTIQSPPIGYVLKLSENTPPNQRIYQVKAQLGSYDVADIKYSLTPISKKDDGLLNIDETSGEIFTAKRLDYETTHRITVLVTARAVFQEGRTDSRLIYVEIIDEDDNEPVFPQNSEETPYLLVVGDEKQKIGKVVAFDVDSSPLNSIYYYLLPSCSNRKGHFSIDHITGEVTFNQPLSALNESRIHLCALASPDADLGSAPEIAFDRHNRSMASITVRTEEQIAAEQKPADPLVVFKNNSHVTLDSTLMDARVPVTEQLASDNSLNYRISNVEFTKAEYDENDEKNKKPISLFSLSPTTGDLHVDTDLITHSEGIYKINVDANMKLTNTRFASLQSEVHYVNPDAKLKFTFDQSRDVMGLNLAEFERKLTDAVRSEGLGSDLTVFLRRPELYKDIDGYNSNKSTACFYVVRNNTILSIEHAVEAISASANSESPLTRLYQVYKVINIERCSDEVASRRIGQFLSPYTIVWITITLVCLLILVAMFGYMCFLTRYRDHLKRKELNFAAKVEKTPPVEDFTIPQFVNINVNQ